MKQCLAAVLLILVVDWVSAFESDIEYSNIWEAEINGGEETAKRVTKDLGYTYHGKLKSFDNRYVVTKDNIPEQSKYKSDHVTKQLQDLEEVKWARQHIVPRRMEDPEASLYFRRLCSVIDPPINSDSSSSAVSTQQSTKPPANNQQPSLNSQPPQTGDNSQNKPSYQPPKPEAYSQPLQTWDYRPNTFALSNPQTNRRPTQQYTFNSRPQYQSSSSSGGTTTTTYSSQNGDTTSETTVIYSNSPILSRPPSRLPTNSRKPPSFDDDFAYLDKLHPPSKTRYRSLE